MKKLILICMMGLLLIGCKKKYDEYTESYQFPPGLEHCKVFHLQSEYGGSMTVVHCPNSTTSTHYSSGKSSSKTVIVVDGVQYQAIK